MSSAKAAALALKDARKALDGKDADLALRHCRAGLRIDKSNVRLLLVAAQACLQLSPPRYADAWTALHRASEVEPDNIQVWGTMRNLLRGHLAEPTSWVCPMSLSDVMQRLLSLTVDDHATHRRLRRELAEHLDDQAAAYGADGKRLSLSIWADFADEDDHALRRVAQLHRELHRDDWEVRLPILDKIRDLKDVDPELMADRTRLYWSAVTSGGLAPTSVLGQFPDDSVDHVAIALMVHRLDATAVSAGKPACKYARLRPWDPTAWQALGAVMASCDVFDSPSLSEAERYALLHPSISTVRSDTAALVIAVEASERFAALHVETRPTRPTEARSRMRQAVQLLGTAPGPREWIDAVKTDLKVTSAALKSSEALRVLGPTSPRAQRLFVDALIEENRFDEVVAAVGSSQDEWARSAREFALFKTGTLTPTEALVNPGRCAEFHVRLGVQLGAQGLQTLMTAARLDPGWSRPWTQLGVYYQTFKRDDERARKCFRKALSLDATDTTAVCQPFVSGQQPVQDTAWAYRALLGAHMRSSQWLDAVGDLQSLLKVSGSSYDLWSQLGFVYRRMGKLDSAAKALQRAIDLCPEDSARARYSLAEIRLYMGMPREAISLLSTGNPSSTAWGIMLARALLERARELIDSGAFAHGQDLLGRARSQLLDLKPSPLFTKFKLLGDIELLRKHRAAARRAYSRCAYLRPGQSSAWFDMGASSTSTIAQHCFRAAIRLDGASARAWSALAMTLPESQRVLRCHCLGRAISLSANSEMQSIAALIALQYGDVDKAVTSIASAQCIDPLCASLWSAYALVQRYTARVGLAESYLAVSQTSREGLFYLRKSNEDQPGSLSVANSLACALSATGDPASALSVLQTVFQPALPVQQSTANVNMAVASALSGHGSEWSDLWHGRQHYKIRIIAGGCGQPSDELVESCVKILRERGESLTSIAPTGTPSLPAKLHRAFASQSISDAIRLAQQCVRDDPSDGRVLVQLAQWHISSRPDRAAPWVAHLPKGIGHALQAVALQYLGDVAGSLKAAQLSVRDDPLNQHGWRLLCMAERQLADVASDGVARRLRRVATAKAIRAVVQQEPQEGVIASRGNDPSIEARASDFIQCCADYLAKRFKPALATCERLLEQWPDWHDVLVLYAIVLRRGRKWQRAKQLLDQAALTTSSPFAVVLRQFNRGLVNGQLGQWEDALADFTSACRAAPLQSPAWFQLGVAHKNLGDARSSTIAYQRAIHLNPSASTYWPEIGSAKS
ncbi:unnamed protein product (mitochondrion) [Plasmodiophora brassicae]|uniref:Uncharacterized protein n=1 Tax=Plasmodiophora brassicae TaxID=37360 RepID=A0A3P3XYQ6_PLABS|nr:unnamed protein product [Plasmodiophora brassicae]